MQADWELSQSLQSDGVGVRCAGVLPPPPTKNNSEPGDTYRLITGQQGGGLAEFRLPTSRTTHLLEFQHDHAVTALLAGSGETCYVTGCKDHVVRVFDATTHALVKEFKGHEKPVTSLAWGDPKERYLLTGSWDGTARVWNMENHSLTATLPNHENSVCVAAVMETTTTKKNDVLTVATGSAGQAAQNSVRDHTVRIWQIHAVTGDVQLLHTVANDHEGPIRDLVAFFAGGSKQQLWLATCSNDGTVKLRDAHTGICVSTLMPFTQQQQEHHPPMLLSLEVGDDYLAASAEDGQVVVWELNHDDDNNDNNGAVASSPPQILRHAECVWKVVALPDGDLATCCQDGVVRLFTRATERTAPPAEREQFAAAVQEKLQKTRNGPSAEEVAKLPLWERNLEQRGTSEGQVQLFQKNGVAIAAQWSAASQTWIEVGEVTGQADTGTVDGVQYDHVFPIEVDQQGGGVASLQIGYNNGENPFAAAQRFVDAHVLPQHHLAEIADYIQQRVGQQPRTLGSTAQQAVTGTPMVTYEYLPARAYKSFELSDKNAAATLDKMKNKMQEFGADEAALTTIGGLMETLAASNRYHASQVSDAELQAVADQLQKTTASQAFPTLDLARLCVLHPDAASAARTTYWKGVVGQAVSLCRRSSSSSNDAPLEGPAAVAIPMLSLRLFANAFKGGPGSREAVAAQLQDVLDCTAPLVQSSNKNIRLSVATVLFNVCFYLHQEQASSSSSSWAPQMIVPLLHDIIVAKTYESEALFRSMVALGTLASSSSTGSATKEAARKFYLASKVEPAASPHTDQLKVLAKEVYSVLQ